MILSWNVHVGGGDLLRVVADLRAGRFTSGEPVEHFVLLLQETFRRGALVPRAPSEPAPARIAPHPDGRDRVDVVAAAARLGVFALYVPSMRNGRGHGEDAEDRGSAILSTLPLHDPGAIELPFERQRRVTLTASVTAQTSAGGRWTLPLVNVHLENRAGARRWWMRSGAARTRQAEALAADLPRSGPLVLGGDLNTWMGSSEGALRAFEHVFDVRVTSASEAGPPRLDFIFARAEPSWTIVTRRPESLFGSDHHPVVAAIRFRGDTIE